MNEEQQVYFHLAAALAIGLLIGVERAWKERDAKEGERIAGLRTHGLIGLLGGGSALLAQPYGELVLGLAFLGVAGLMSAAYVINIRQNNTSVGITSLIASLLTFVLGALAASGEVALAAACAVVVTILLGYKPVLHSWVGALEEVELRAGLKLLLISVVLLPVLPNQGYGLFEAINPYAIWWMVVVVAAISFVGYFAIKIGGPRHGIVFTGMFGGLASSTALTLHFSRMGRENHALAPVVATGILLACGTMFPRMVLVAGVFSPRLLIPLLMPAAVMAIFAYGAALFFWHAQKSKKTEEISLLKNPLELKTALSFGVLLALVMFLGKALRHWFGDTGVLVLSAASGVADVDAITLSLARMSQNDLALKVAVMGVVIAAAVNSIAKGIMSLAIGGWEIGWRVGLPLLISAVGGMITSWIWLW